MAMTPAADLARLKVTYGGWVFARDGKQFTATHRDHRRLVLQAANPLLLESHVLRQEDVISGRVNHPGRSKVTENGHGR